MADADCPFCEDEGTKGYELGQIVGLEQAAGICLEDAASYFKNGNDNAAQQYRLTAGRLKNIASGKRMEYDAKYDKPTPKGGEKGR